MISPARKALTLALVAALIAALATPSVALAKKRATRQSPGATATQKMSRGRGPAKSAPGKSADAGRTSQQESQFVATGEAEDTNGDDVTIVAPVGKKKSAKTAKSAAAPKVKKEKKGLPSLEAVEDDDPSASEDTSRGVANAFDRIWRNLQRAQQNPNHPHTPWGLWQVLHKFAGWLGIDLAEMGLYGDSASDASDDTSGTVDPSDGTSGTVDPSDGTSGTVDPSDGTSGTVDPSDGTSGTVDPPGDATEENTSPDVSSGSLFPFTPPPPTHYDDAMRASAPCEGCHNPDWSLIVPAPSP